MADSNPPIESNEPEVMEQSHEEAVAPSPAVAPTPPPAPVAAPAPARRVVKREYSGKKETMNGPLYMQASNNVVIVRRVKRKGNDNPWKQLATWFVENQIGTLASPLLLGS